MESYDVGFEVLEWRHSSSIPSVFIFRRRVVGIWNCRSEGVTGKICCKIVAPAGSTVEEKRGESNAPTPPCTLFCGKSCCRIRCRLNPF